LKKYFVSYATPDREIALLLEQQLKPDAWVDLYEIDIGAMFLAEIADAIELSTDFVLLWSRHSERSSWVRFEVHMAFIRWMEDKAITLRIVALDDTSLPLYLRPFQQAKGETDPFAIAANLLGPPPEKPQSRAFFDRNPEVEAIETALYSSIMMVWLWGMQGIGKRTLAYAAARRFRPTFRQVLRVELRPGTREVELDLQLAAALRTEPSPAPNPGTKWWKDGTHFDVAGKDANALLDDFARSGGLWIFEDSQHWLDDDARPSKLLLSIFSTLSHAGCGAADRLAIFTSTRKPTLAPEWSAKSSVVKLEGLPNIFAEALLLARGTPKEARGRVPDAARQLGGHPLAIELAATRLGEQDLDWDEFRVKIAADLIGGAPIAEPTREVLQIVAAVDGPFPGEDIASHLGLDISAFQIAIAEASSLALLHQVDDGFPRLHPLVRDFFLRDLLARPDSQQRFADLAARSEGFFRSLTPASTVHINALMTTFRLYSLALDLERALALRSDLTGLLYDCGLDLYQSRQYTEALAYFEEVCVQDPRDDSAQLFRAKCLGELHRMSEARELVDDVLAHRPNDHVALRIRGRLEYVGKNFHDAVAFYERAARARPDYAPSLRDLAQARMRVDDWPGAIIALEEGLAKGNPTAIDLSVYADILEKQGFRDRARDLLARALRQQPKDEMLLSQAEALTRYDLFAFGAGESAIIIVPSLSSEDANSPQTGHHEMVAAEDVFAAQALERALVSAHWPAERLENMRVAATFDIPDRRNLVSICSPKRNPVTQLILAHPVVERATGFRFESYEGLDKSEEPRWRMVLDGRVIESPSYDEQRAPRAPGAVELSLHDRAVILRARNPWNSHARIVVVAGLRAFGTQGAAEFLLAKGVTLTEKSNGSDFVAIIDVELVDGHVRSGLSSFFKRIP